MSNTEYEIWAGQIREDAHGRYRVLSVAEGYVMCRRPYAMPFVRSVKDVAKDVQIPVPASAGDGGNGK